MLSDSLEERRFKKRAIDPYLFAREDYSIATYADNCLIFCKKKEVLLNLIELLKGDFKMTDEGDLELFLTTQLKKTGSNTLELL